MWFNWFTFHSESNYLTLPPERTRFFLELFSEKRHPLSTLVALLDFETLRPLDILLNSRLDILDDACYFTILRMVASRQIGTIIAAPPCTEYSLLKLKQPEREFGLGAWLNIPGQAGFWSSFMRTTPDLPAEWRAEHLQRHINSFKTLAQCMVLIIFNSLNLGAEDFQIISKVDNQASEDILAQGSTQIPLTSSLTQAFQRLTYTSVQLFPYIDALQLTTRGQTTLVGAEFHRNYHGIDSILRLITSSQQDIHHSLTRMH